MSSYPILYNINEIKFGKITNNREILDLFNIVFNKTFDEDILEWFAACPTGKNIWYGAFEKDEPVGLYGLLPIKISIDDIVYLGALCNNVGIIPAFQGKGLFQSLGKYALNDSNFPIVLGVPNLKSIKGHKRIGWKSYGLLELLSGSVNAKKIESVEYERFQYFGSSERKNLFVVKDFDFIKWRYSKPNTVYKQTSLKNNRYVIWKEYIGKIQILETNDFEMIFELAGTVDIWQFGGSFESEALKKRGFTSVMSNEFIVYNNNNVLIDNSVDLIEFQLGDNDVF